MLRTSYTGEFFFTFYSSTSPLSPRKTRRYEVTNDKVDEETVRFNRSWEFHRKVHRSSGSPLPKYDNSSVRGEFDFTYNVAFRVTIHRAGRKTFATFHRYRYPRHTGIALNFFRKREYSYARRDCLHADLHTGTFPTARATYSETMCTSSLIRAPDTTLRHLCIEFTEESRWIDLIANRSRFDRVREINETMVSQRSI